VPVLPIAPPLPLPVLSAQYWDNLTFVHWPVDAAAVAGLFPPGSRPDEFDGTSYVGFVPFQMRGAGPSRLPVPYFGSFCETNVRLYSVDDQDRHGVVFATLDANRLATVLLARVGLGLPYAWSAMSTRRVGDELTYRSLRRWPQRSRRAASMLSVRVGGTVQPTGLETWLTARWGLHTQVAGRSIWVPNHHDSWPLHQADLLALDTDLVAACGIEIDEDRRLRGLFSPGVRTTFGRPVLL